MISRFGVEKREAIAAGTSGARLRLLTLSKLEIRRRVQWGSRARGDKRCAV